MVINPPPSLGALTFGQWTANLAGFNGTIAASTGTGPAILTVIGGALPTGLTASLSGDAITFAGDPTIAGTYSFTLKLTDSLGVFACRSYTIVIDPAKTLVWTGRGSNDLWNDAANWSGAVPVAGDTLIFGAGSADGQRQQFCCKHNLRVHRLPGQRLFAYWKRHQALGRH